ncbi:MAG: DUF1080 domain-containing protein [Planctomycetota bacterium]
MRFPVVRLAIAFCLAQSITITFAQDLKKGVTDLAQVDADFHIQGEYSGSVTSADGWCRAVGLQVVALGDGKFDALWYRGGLPGNGYDGSTRLKLSGQRAGDKVVLAGDGQTIELQPGYAASVKNPTGFIVGNLSPMHRYSLTARAAPPANAIVLFDGKSTDRLKNAKVTPDGLLEIGCETKDPVQNFTLHAEFRTPYMPYAKGQARGNSGFYLQKRYEVQVLDSFGLELQFNDCASLYRFKAPDLNMSFPPLSWQTYDIDFTAPKFDADGQRTAKGRITVRHNGIVVHNNLELENKTGGGSVEGPNPLPILFQNHGNAVHFRNVWLIDKDATPTHPASCGVPAPSFAETDCSGGTHPTCCVPEMRCRSVRHRRWR